MDRIDYRLLMARALKGVVRMALEQVEEHGLPGSHHFFLTFRSKDPGVLLPGFLREQFPEEMTIVLQNQFWDLVVDDEAFSVSLKFNNALHRVVVPWEALAGFVDPAAEFGLRFDENELDGESSTQEVTEQVQEAEESEEAEATDDSASTKSADSANVISFDRFRNKDDEA